MELQPRKADEFPIDVTTFGFPTWCYYYSNEPYLKVLIHVDFMHPGASKQPNDDYFVHFVDPEDKCKDYRPTVLNETNFLNLNLLANTKSAKYAYYFIKKDNFICSYVFVYDDLFNSFYSNILEIKPVNFYLIKNYPTENYAPNFFCIDVLYGTFVSLYWNRQSPLKNRKILRVLPLSAEAHYYIINEKDLTNIKLIDKMVLNEFDENILKDIFDNKFDESFYPTFTSYGRQIFISFKLVSDKKFAFNGFWKNESEYDVHFQDFQIGVRPLADNYKRKLFRAKKSWIQYDRPVGRESAESTPPPLPQPQPLTETPPPAPSTTKLSTTAPPPTTQPSTSLKTTTVSATKTFPFKSSSIIDSSTAPSTSSPTTTTTSNNSNATNKGTNSILPTPQAQNSGTTATSSSNGFGCFIYENPWILYLIIAIDICEIIIIILLIIFKFRGAKKMKEAMAKKNVQKSTKKNKKKQSSEAMPIKKSSKKKKQKKSTTEKSATKTEDDGKTLIAVPKNTTTSVDQGTNYFTVNQSFAHSVQKK
uniref:Uncharacterized protein n=1 Tax=Panagrolaimus davidi TaxID=227884 RepID=A0A914QU11_9BILA